MWEYERCLFVKKLLAVLYKKELKTIPINDDSFKNGVQEAADYFTSCKDQLGDRADIFAPLFVRYTTSGEFKDFSRVIDSFNGRILSFENPYYVKANIRMEKEYVDELIAEQELGLPEQFVQKMAEKFAEGAQLYRLN